MPAQGGAALVHDAFAMGGIERIGDLNGNRPTTKWESLPQGIDGKLHTA